MTKAEAEALCAKLEAQGQRAAVVSTAECEILRRMSAEVECGRCTLKDFAQCAITLGVMGFDDVNKNVQVQIIAYQGETVRGVGQDVFDKAVYEEIMAGHLTKTFVFMSRVPVMWAVEVQAKGLVEAIKLAENVPPQVSCDHCANAGKGLWAMAKELDTHPAAAKLAGVWVDGVELPLVQEIADLWRAGVDPDFANCGDGKDDEVNDAN